MLVESVSIRNFRSFGQFNLDLGGDSVTLVAPNAGGKTAF